MPLFKEINSPLDGHLSEEEYDTGEENFIDDEFSDDEDFVPTQRKKRMRTTAIIPGHLQTPINRDEVDILLANEEFYCSRHNRQKAWSVNKKVRSLIEVSQDPISCVQNWVRDNITVDDIDFRYDRMIDSMENWTLHKLNSLQNLDGLRPDEILAKCYVTTEVVKRGMKFIRPMFIEKCQVEKLKDNICNKEILHGSLLGYMDLDIEGDIAFMHCKCCGSTILPTSLFLCALDKMQTKFYTHLLWILSDACEKYPDRSIFDRGTLTYR